MKQSRTAAHPHHASGRHGPPVSIGISLAAIACLILLATLVAGRPLRAQPRASAASTGPLLQTDVASGPPGTVVQLEGQSLPRIADAVPSVFTFESTPSPQISLPLPQPAITGCSNNIPSWGFGIPCTTTPYSFQIPLAIPPGSYQFHLVTPSATGVAPYVDITAPFQVTAPATLTPTATTTATVTSTAATTDTATATAMATATSTSTAVPNAPTATITPVPPPLTSTPVPATATLVPATATATATPKPQPFLALVRPEFTHDRIAIALRAGAGATVHVDFTITAGGHTLFHAAKDGTTNKLGAFGLNLAIAYPAHKPGQALLTIKESDAAGTKTVMRTFHYRYF